MRTIRVGSVMVTALGTIGAHQEAKGGRVLYHTAQEATIVIIPVISYVDKEAVQGELTSSAVGRSIVLTILENEVMRVQAEEVVAVLSLDIHDGVLSTSNIDVAVGFER